MEVHPSIVQLMYDELESLIVTDWFDKAFVSG